MTILREGSATMEATAIASQSGQRGGTSNEMNISSLENQFDFVAHEKYQASFDLLTTRSKTFCAPPKPYNDDIWNRKPPDFRPQTYLPKPPKRNTRESMQPWKYFTESTDKEINLKKKRHKGVELPKVLQPKRPKSRKMNLKFNIPSSDDARKDFVKKGVHPKDVYVNPKPHDFRQYPKLQKLGLPEFLTCKTPDPQNIKFKNRNLDIYHGVPQPPTDEYNGDQMGHPLGSQPRYEPDLLLPRGKWPTIPQEFTRHRPRVRTPHTALMDTIEDRLTKQWAVEKEERVKKEKETERRLQHQKLQTEIKKGITKAMERKQSSFNEFDAIPKYQQRHNRYSGSSSTSNGTSTSSM